MCANTHISGEKKGRCLLLCGPDLHLSVLVVAASTRRHNIISQWQPNDIAPAPRQSLSWKLRRGACDAWCYGRARQHAKTIMRLLLLIVIFALTSFPYSAQTPSTPALFPIEIKRKHGYIDSSGRIVIRPQFDDAWGFSEGLAPVRVSDKWGFINKTGTIVSAPQFFEVSSFQEGLAVVGAFFKSGPINSVVGNYGYIDHTGRFAIAPQFGVAFGFSNGLALIQTADYKNGYIDKSGKVVFWEKRLCEDFSDNLALFTTNGNMPDSRTGYLDLTGHEAIAPTFDFGESFSEGLACVSQNKKSGFIDTKGNVAIPFRFDNCRSFSEGLAAVMIDGKRGYIDKTGKLVIEVRFAEAEVFSDGIATVRALSASDTPRQKRQYKLGDIITSVMSGKFGAIDRNGRTILPMKFVQLGEFSDGLAWVNLGKDYIVHGNPDRWGYINKAGKFVWTSR